MFVGTLKVLNVEEPPVEAANNSIIAGGCRRDHWSD